MRKLQQIKELNNSSEEDDMTRMIAGAAVNDDIINRFGDGEMNN